MENTLNKRRSGILTHVSSLPSQYGIGDIGTSAYEFIRYLKKSGQSCWQFLPLTPTNPLFDNSPYMSISAFAGSPMLISPDLLYEEGLLNKRDLENHPAFSIYQTEYEKVGEFKTGLLKIAFENFNLKNDENFNEFLTENEWVIDYALFMALKEHFNDAPWFDWPKNIQRRTKKSIQSYTEKLEQTISYYCFEQYIFYKQMDLLRSKCDELEILLFGDIPIYVGLDSVDVWAHQAIFSLDSKTGLPNLVSGVPPDYFSKTGQKWGNPLYRWNDDSSHVQRKLVDWWAQRFTTVFKQAHIARIDHFRAFESYWAIPAENETAIDGEWLPGPGKKFFKKIENKLGKLDIVAEDLGIITEKVTKLRDNLGFPGMKVLQFAFDGDPNNSFLPFNFESNHCVVYTGTHDNETTVGWYLGDQLDDELRKKIKQMCNRELHDHSSIHTDLIHLALSSTANLAILPLQDILGFGNDCRMNTPGEPEGNWVWRCAPQFLTDEVAGWLQHQTTLYNR